MTDQETRNTSSELEEKEITAAETPLPQTEESASEPVSATAEPVPAEEDTPAEEPASEVEQSAPPEAAPAPEEPTAETPEETAAGEKKSDEAEKKPADPAGLSGIRVAMELCDRVSEAVEPGEFHGGVRPDNISVRDSQVFLGGILRHGVGEFTPQELEYMAPELFWDGIRSPAADVYSVGLVLYSIYNYGRLPFWPGSGAVTPNARASALQKRMSDEALLPPAKADAELSAVILRALAFRVEERWQDVQELKSALSSCDESSSPVDISLAMSGLLTRTADGGDRRTVAPKSRTYYDDGEIHEGRRPVRRKSLTWLWMLIFGALIVGAAVLLMTTFRNDSVSNEGKVPVGLEATSTPEPLITPVPTPEITPTPEPTEKPHGPQYVVHVENVSWEQAVVRCRELGGTLAIPANEEEYKELIRVCTSARVNYVWLGASRQADGNWITCEGEPVTFFNWGAGEPSFTDSGDGAAEDYLMMWRRDTAWPYNDMREDPLADYAFIYGSAIGFVCKMW